MLSFPVPHTLRRNLSLYPDDVPNGRPHNLTLTPTAVANHTQQTTPGNFLGFQHAIEQMHDHVHNFVGGDLAGTCPKALSEIQGGNCSHAYTPNGES
jgi:tyrosinase